jgi:hypothetical protein
MKILKTSISFLFLLLIASCSSDSDNNSTDDGPVIEDDFFTLTIDGVDKEISQWSAQRSENTIYVYGITEDATAIQLTFNKFGNVGDVNTFNIENTDFPDRYNYQYNRAAYFDFELVSIDETLRIVTVNYSGKVYDDNTDLTSAFSEIEGSFQLTYENATPQIAGLGLTATLNGQPWYDTDTTTSYSNPGGLVANNFSSDNLYSISIVTGHESTAVGEYVFDASSDKDKVVVWGYSATTKEEEEYESTSGTLTITEKTVGASYTVLAGTFSIVATDPDTGNEVTITNGSFKTVYTNL